MKVEAHAVRSLRTGVVRYAESIQRVNSQARGRAGAAARNANQAVDRRRDEYQKRSAELKRAQQALSSCQENCGGLQREVAAASERLGAARASLDRARQAAQLAGEAQRDLIRVLQTVDSKVNEHSSVASSALADLDAKLAALPHVGVADTLRGLAVGVATFARVATAIPDAAHLVGNAAAATGHDNPFANSSLSEMRQESSAQEQDHWADAERERRSRSARHTDVVGDS